ncbi:hypothetical protein CL619_04300 [archaeon]|nr:hypothetical protein [archaeon]|tara:strand:+ start:278 stop:1135 length:858 start_codon:yes stop_codon:yes gene_type:complete
MYSFRTITKLLRVQQWYKNTVVFVALLFSENLFDPKLLVLSILAFFALSFVSSANYIINDIKDKEKDTKHLLRKNRPIAAGIVSIRNAKTIAGLFLILGLTLAAFLNPLFLILTIILFLLMQIYTFSFKRYLYLDIIMISLFFVIRAILGALAILVWISPWLIICPFFLAGFLVSGKRYSEIALLKDKAEKTREVLGKYSLKSSMRFLKISSTLLLLSFTIYSIQKNWLLLISLPFAFWALIRYLNLIKIDPKVGIQTQLALKDKKLIILSISWVLVIALTLYLS